MYSSWHEQMWRKSCNEPHTNVNTSKTHACNDTHTYVHVASFNCIYLNIFSISNSHAQTMSEKVHEWSNNVHKSYLDILPKLLSNASNKPRSCYNLNVYNPNCNTIFKFTNVGISRINGGVRSRERWWSVSVVSI